MLLFDNAIGLPTFLSADCCRVNDLENRIGAGLIEEVIQVAEGEYQLVDKMVESKV